MADKNEAQIVIKTINDTDGGFKEVASNFEDFDKEIQNLEKNLKPLQTLLDAGIASGAGVSAVGAYTKNLGDMGGAVADLKSEFLGISEAAGEAGESMGLFGSITAESLKIATGMTKVLTAVKGAFEIGKKLKQAYAAANVLIAEHKLMQEAAAVATAASTATTTANAAATAAEATAKEAASATFVADTISETVNTVATSANTAAKGTNAAATGAASASTGIFAAASWVATAAVSALNIALALNPFAVYAVAIAAVIAVIWGVFKAIGSLCTWLNNTHEATAKAAESTRKLREENEKTRAECDTYRDRLDVMLPICQGGHYV